MKFSPFPFSFYRSLGWTHLCRKLLLFDWLILNKVNIISSSIHFFLCNPKFSHLLSGVQSKVHFRFVSVSCRITKHFIATLIEYLFLVTHVCAHPPPLTPDLRPRLTRAAPFSCLFFIKVVHCFLRWFGCSRWVWFGVASVFIYTLGCISGSEG